MLFMKMDLLNYPYLDKVDNSVSILCYEGSCSRNYCSPALARPLLPFGLGLPSERFALSGDRGALGGPADSGLV